MVDIFGVTIMNVDIYQSGSHTHWLDIHADEVEHEVWQEGAGSHYSHVTTMVILMAQSLT